LAVQQCTMPEMTEDFLSKLGIATEEELHSFVEKLLNDQADKYVKEKLHEQVNTFLIEKYSF
jgi:FKBP-type peptidyl-prolyl cis-trans isomerase (trigger factor)